MVKNSTPSSCWYRMPYWLQELENLAHLPLRNLLRYSLYYPACGTDRGPVRLLGGYIHSFIYVDYLMNKADALQYIEGEGQGFHGYRLIMLRDVDSSELIPDGWHPSVLLPSDGNPEAYRSQMPAPFALWAIYERLPEFDHVHGPARFSLLHICGDGAATYEALYNTQRVQPDVIAIIRSGDDLSGQNWTDFADDQKILARTASKSRGGKPRYLLQETLSRECYWQGYDTKLDTWSAPDGHYAIYACTNPYSDDDDGEIARHHYETFKRLRDEALQKS